MHTQILSNYVTALESTLQNVQEQLQAYPDNYRTFDGDPSRLWDGSAETSSQESDFYREVADWLDECDKDWRSILYWFEIDSAYEPQQVLERFFQFKNTPTERRTPALKKSAYRNNSSILYVGKKQNGDMKGRIYTHLGYNNNPQHPGLQLHHWAKGISFKLHIWSVWMHRESLPLLEVFERRLAEHLQPLIGKHL